MVRSTRVRLLAIASVLLGIIAVAMLIGSATAASTALTDDGTEETTGLTAEVTDTTLFGDVRTVTVSATDLESDRVVIAVGEQSKTVVRPTDGQIETTLVVGSYFRGPDDPLVVTAMTEEGARYAGTVHTDNGAVTLTPTSSQPSSAFESARVSVPHTGLFGTAQAVTFEYHAPEGAIVEFEAGWMHSRVVSDGQPAQHTVYTGWGFAPYPLDVRASIEDGQTVETTLTYFDDTVTLVDGSNDTGSAQFGVGLADNNGTVGETVTVTGTVTNEGTAAGSQSVTLSVGNNSTSEMVSLDPGQSTTVSLNLTPSTGDAGNYTATLESANDSATATVKIEDEEESSPGLQSATALVKEGSLSIGDSVAFDLGGCSEDSEQCNLVQAALGEDGSLSVAEDGFQFAPLKTYASSLQGNVSVVTTAPEGLDGSVDMETGTVQLDGTLDAEIPEFTKLLEEQQPSYNATCGFQIDISTTTGSSGDFSGTPLSVDSESGVATATLVDGTYEVGTISEERCGPLAGQIDSELGLPSESGSNELTLGLELQLSQDATPDPEVTDLSVTESVSEGETATVEATVENTGGAGQTQVRAVVDEAAAFDSVVDSRLVEIGAGETETVELAWDTSESLTVFNFSAGGNVPLGPGDYTISAESGDSAKSAGVTIESGDDEDEGDDGNEGDDGDGGSPPISGFTAYGQQGNITLGGNTEDPIVLPRCDGTTPLDSPDDQITWEDTCFEIDVDSLDFSEDGTMANFSVGSEDVTFPQIQTRDVSADYANVSLSAPDGFEGTVNLGTGAVTISGQFEIFVEVRGSLLGDADCKTQTTLEMTTGTGEQGIVEGAPLSLDGATGNTTIVSDSFTVPGFETVSGSGTVCNTAQGQYGLPAETPGDNTFQFALLIQLEQ
jgi:hypothetical protein